jgi:hypothetical protein
VNGIPSSNFSDQHPDWDRKGGLPSMHCVADDGTSSGKPAFCQY